MRWALPLALVLTFAVVLATHDVPTQLSDEDAQVARQLILPTGIIPVGDAKANWSYEAQVAAVRKIQALVLAIAPGNDPIPEDHTRELHDLVSFGSGLCYDRSRSIETLLRYVGFTVRHLSIYAEPGGETALRALLTPGDSSHAVTEVMTSHGWLVVDSNQSWISIDQAGEPVRMATIAADADASRNDRVYQDGASSPILQARFTYVVGLFSRHGRFFPPYDGIPDFSLKEGLVLAFL